MVLVTGASGFIGQYLVKKLTEEGFKVIAASRSIKEGYDNHPHVKEISMDITRRKDFSKLPGGIEGVFHLAAFIPPTDEPKYVRPCLKINALGTLNLIEFCQEKKIKKIVYSSSISVYDNRASRSISEEEKTYPSTFYGSSKLLAELYGAAWARELGGQFISLRYSAVYGFGVKPYFVLPIFYENIKKDKDLQIFGSGESVMDYVYVKDVVSANLSAYLYGKGGIYNIGSGKGTSLIELAKTIKDIFPESKSKIVFAKTKPSKKSKVWLDISKAEKELSFKVKYPLKEGLKDYKKISKKVRGKH